ncbi:MAG TPA: response regulator [Verrucomicrobiae bacterium]|nr:response regulator [Verrucomicrobiae bacterium]
MKEKILLVDEDPAVRRMLVRVLADEGYHVVAAADGEEATAKTAEDCIDLIVMNVSGRAAPDPSFCYRIGSRREIPIILTSNAKQTPQSLSAAGAVMEKPFDLAELLRIIQEKLRWSPPASRASGVS